MKTLIILLLLIPTLAFSADFTIDKRSILHVGASGVLAGTANTMLVEYNVPQVQRNVAAFSFAFGVGLIKEFAMDSSPDYGDIMFNGIGALGALWISEKYFILPSEKGVTVGGKF